MPTTEAIREFNNPDSYLQWFDEKQQNSTSEYVQTIDGLGIHLREPQRLADFMDPSKKNLPVFLLVSGSSESGKSHLGKRFVEMHYGHRLKLGYAIHMLQEKKGIKDKKSFLKILSETTSQDQQDSLIHNVSEEFFRIMNETGVYTGVVETIKHPWVIQAFERIPNIRVFNIFVDADLSERVKRESLKTGIPTDEMLASILDKDAEKKAYGNEHIAEDAPLYIENDGSIVSYNACIDALSKISHSDKTSGTKCIDFTLQKNS